MASSNLSPPTRTDPLYTIPPKEIMATSVVPPPISTTMEPLASDTDKPAPIAAAMGSSIKYTWLAPAPKADSRMARRSTWVEPQGTPAQHVCAQPPHYRLCTLRLDPGRAAGYTDDNAGAGRKHAAPVYHPDKLLEHLLSHCKIGNHPIFHWAYCLDIARHPSKHLLGFLPDCLNDFLAIGAAIMTDSNHRRLIKHNTFTPYINKRIGRAEVNGHITGEITA